MNNSAQRQRVIELPSARARAKPKKKKVLDEISRRRQQDLLSHWRLLKALGMPLRPTHMAKRVKVNFTVPSQYLNGSIALNIDWMMEFATEMCCAPQVIFRDWPYAHMTPTSLPPELIELIHRWRSVSPKTLSRIQEIIDRDLLRL